MSKNLLIEKELKDEINSSLMTTKTCETNY